jgi:hypothetical protein
MGQLRVALPNFVESISNPNRPVRGIGEIARTPRSNFIELKSISVPVSFSIRDINNVTTKLLDTGDPGIGFPSYNNTNFGHFVLDTPSGPINLARVAAGLNPTYTFTYEQLESICRTGALPGRSMSPQPMTVRPMANLAQFGAGPCPDDKVFAGCMTPSGLMNPFGCGPNDTPICVSKGGSGGSADRSQFPGDLRDPFEPAKARRIPSIRGFEPAEARRLPAIQLNRRALSGR